MKLLSNLFLFLIICSTSTTLEAQFLRKLKDGVQNAAERTVQRKAEQEAARKTE